MTSPDIMRFGVTSTTPATRRRNFLGEDRKSGVAHTGKVAGRLLADFAFRYDAAGRLVKEGDRTYRYGYLDKVLSVTEGPRTYTYDYHVDGQLARADYENGTGDDGRAVSTKPPPPASSEDFLWDGLALIKRGDERFVNEPHVGGGNPVTSSKGTTYFNDVLGTTVGIREGRAPSRPKSPRYSAAALTAFGESIPASQPLNTSTSQQFFTGKPHVAGLGHAFLFRNYRAGLAKWQTADPLGYPDGWNQLAYCGNGVVQAVDTYSLWTLQIGIFLFGGAITSVTIQAGIAIGLSWEEGFSWGWYYNGGIGSEIGTSASTGIVFTTTNSRNVGELAGQALAVGISAGEGFVVGVDAVIPLNIAETGYWGLDFSIGLGVGTPAEGHAVYNFTGFFKVYE